MGITSRAQNKNWDDHYDDIFKKPKMDVLRPAVQGGSKYKAVWQPYSKNEDFWKEVLVGRRIVGIEFDSDHLNVLVLDSGERVKILNNEKGKGVIAIED